MAEQDWIEAWGYLNSSSGDLAGTTHDKRTAGLWREHKNEVIRLIPETSFVDVEGLAEALDRLLRELCGMPDTLKPSEVLDLIRRHIKPSESPTPTQRG